MENGDGIVSVKFVSPVPLRFKIILHFDSDEMAPYVHARPSPALFALIKSRLGSHWLKVETDRWLPSRPPRDERICRHCHTQAVEDEQHLLFGWSVYTAIREQHSFLFGHDRGSIRLCLERNADQMPSVARYIHLSGCPMSHIWTVTLNTCTNCSNLPTGTSALWHKGCSIRITATQPRTLSDDP